MGLRITETKEVERALEILQLKSVVYGSRKKESQNSKGVAGLEVGLVLIPLINATWFYSKSVLITAGVTGVSVFCPLHASRCYS